MSDFITKLSELIDPEVMGDMVSARIPKKLRVAPFAKIDDTLQGVPGDTITVPAYTYIGDASDVAEGGEVAIEKMTTSTRKATIKKAMKGIGLTDEAVLSGYGNPVGEANTQLAQAIAAKVDNDCMDALQTASLIYDGSQAQISYNAIVEAMESGTVDVGIMPPATYAQAREMGVAKAILSTTLNDYDENEQLMPGVPVGSFKAEVLVRADSGITGYEGLAGKTIAYLGASSASGYIYPSLWLQEHYGKTIADLDHVVQSDSHSTSLARLATGQADVMVSFGHIRIKNAPNWQEKFGGTAPMVEQTGVIGVTEGIYNDMIAYSKHSDLMADEAFRKALGEAFIEIAQTDEGKQIISVFSQVGYTWGKDSDYDGERDAQAMLKSAGK